jgi:hypothetical protein
MWTSQLPCPKKTRFDEIGWKMGRKSRGIDQTGTNPHESDGGREAGNDRAKNYGGETGISMIDGAMKREGIKGRRSSRLRQRSEPDTMVRGHRADVVQNRGKMKRMQKNEIAGNARPLRRGYEAKTLPQRRRSRKIAHRNVMLQMLNGERKRESCPRLR